MPMRTITLEEHYTSPAFMAGQGSQLRRPAQARPGMGQIVDQLSDVGQRRIVEMDAAGIDMQVLSLNSPGVEQLDAPEAVKIARQTNDWLAQAIQKYPERLAGFATLPTQDPKIAAGELERTVRDFGFKGAAINGHTQGHYLDDEFFWPILERAETLKVPIYIHPTLPPQPVIKAYYTGNFAPEVTGMLAMAGWGWHIETAVHVLRIILSGAFDRYPDLQVIIGHLGEGLSSMMSRIDHTMPEQVTKLKRPVGAYLRENLHYTFSGFNYIAPFLDLMLNVGVERIMFSADYPYASMAEARTFLEQLPVSPADKERIAHGNAERLLRL
jgi:uncharacterized protein